MQLAARITYLQKLQTHKESKVISPKDLPKEELEQVIADTFKIIKLMAEKGDERAIEALTSLNNEFDGVLAVMIAMWMITKGANPFIDDENTDKWMEQFRG